VLINDSRQPVTLEAASVGTLGPGLEVVGYPVYNVADTDWTVLDALDEAIPSTPDIIKASRYKVNGLVIKPGEQSRFIVTVRVRVTAANPGSIHGCVVRYRTAGKLYQQKFSCWFAFGEL
jgi:hypothetical protein